MPCSPVSRGGYYRHPWRFRLWQDCATVQAFSKYSNSDLIVYVGCFEKGTSVLMADGNVRAIETINVGEQVLGPDGSPRHVIALPRGNEMMYHVVEKSSTSSSLPGGINYTCNAAHQLVAFTPTIASISNTIIDRQMHSAVSFFSVEPFATQDGRTIELVQEKQQSWSWALGEAKGRRVCSCLLRLSSQGYIFKWTIEARDLVLLEPRVRQVTYQKWAPVLTERTEFADMVEKIEDADNSPLALAYSLGKYAASQGTTTTTSDSAVCSLASTLGIKQPNSRSIYTTYFNRSMSVSTFWPVSSVPAVTWMARVMWSCPLCPMLCAMVLLGSLDLWVYLLLLTRNSRLVFLILKISKSSITSLWSPLRPFPLFSARAILLISWSPLPPPMLFAKLHAFFFYCSETASND